MNEPFEAKNELEKRLVAVQAGELPGDQFMSELLTSEVFMPILDKHGIGGFQGSDKAEPLTLEDEQGQSVLILFTSPERARNFVRDYPGYEGGLLAEMKWILERVGSGIGVSFNPDSSSGFDMAPDMVQQLGQMAGE